MLINPFTPSEIAADPRDFFGRTKELHQLEQTLAKSSALIQGKMGIGKSSLTYQLRQRMEGFDSNHNSKSILVVCHRDIASIDEVARAVLERIVSISSKTKKVTWKVAYINFVETESSEIANYFEEGRHMAALVRLLEKDYLSNFVKENELFIIAIDEADKQPLVLSQFVRTVLTETQGNGIPNIRFLLSGIRPYFQSMLDDDGGMIRFFPSPLTLHPLNPQESEDLMQTKFAEVMRAATREGIDCGVHPDVISRAVTLSGGHPHLLQLLGSHLIDSESQDPDGIIDSRDFVAAITRICLRDRNAIYNDIFIKLESEYMLEPFATLLSAMSNTFPTQILRARAHDVLLPDEVKWLRNHNLIYEQDYSYYLDDEFLKVRIIIDRDQRFYDQSELEESYTLLCEMENIDGSSEDDMTYNYFDDRLDDEDDNQW